MRKFRIPLKQKAGISLHCSYYGKITFFLRADAALCAEKGADRLKNIEENRISPHE